MSSNIKLGYVGLLACGVLGAGACLGPVELPPEPVGEAKQELVTCTSQCSDISGAQPITKTCNASCTATNSQITCDGVVTLCTAQCVSNYGATCNAELCHCCGARRWTVGTIDCSGACLSNDYCCCDSCHWC